TGNVERDQAGSVQVEVLEMGTRAADDVVLELRPTVDPLHAVDEEVQRGVVRVDDVEDADATRHASPVRRAPAPAPPPARLRCPRRSADAGTGSGSTRAPPRHGSAPRRADGPLLDGAGGPRAAPDRLRCAGSR